MSARTNLKLATRRYALGFGVTWEAYRYFRWWFISIAAVAMLAPLAIDQFSSAQIDLSAWELVASAGKIFSAIIAGTFLYTLIPIALAQGLTRREYSTAMALFGLGWSLVLGVIAVAGLLLEHLWYGLFDWNQALRGEAGEITLGALRDVLVHGLHYPLSYLLFFTGGALIGAAAYRWDGGWLVLVPVASVVYALDFALTSSQAAGPTWFRWLTGLTGDASTPAAAAAMVVLIVAMAWICRSILLRTPVRAKKA